MFSECFTSVHFRQSYSPSCEHRHFDLLGKSNIQPKPSFEPNTNMHIAHHHCKQKITKPQYILYSAQKHAMSPTFCTLHIHTKGILFAIFIVFLRIYMSASQLHSLNKCINRAVHKNFGVRSAECINDVQRFVGLEDLAKLVENRRSKFIDKLIVSGEHVDLCSAAVHISR